MFLAFCGSFLYLRLFLNVATQQYNNIRFTFFLLFFLNLQNHRNSTKQKSKNKNKKKQKATTVAGVLNVGLPLKVWASVASNAAFQYGLVNGAYRNVYIYGL